MQATTLFPSRLSRRISLFLLPKEGIPISKQNQETQDGRQTPEGPTTPPERLHTATETELSLRLTEVEKEIALLKSDQTRFLTRDDTATTANEAMTTLNGNFNSFMAELRENYRGLKEDYADLKIEIKIFKDSSRVHQVDYKTLKANAEKEYLISNATLELIMYILLLVTGVTSWSIFLRHFHII
ncbi:MAG: hypothetical protein LBT40_16030 [Deltaproteobacteria bacterium]|nr:hypothetical protein [Deltaproteobacteria bacterium]